MGHTIVATMRFARLLRSSMPWMSPDASNRLMLGRKAQLTDRRNRFIRGPRTAAIENEANDPREKSAAATHWAAGMRKPYSAPGTPSGAAYLSWSEKTRRARIGACRP